MVSGACVAVSGVDEVTAGTALAEHGSRREANKKKPMTVTVFRRQLQRLFCRLKAWCVYIVIRVKLLNDHFSFHFEDFNFVLS